MTLKVTPQEVQQKSSQMDTTSVSMENRAKQIEQEVVKLQDVWQSKSGSEFLARYKTLQANCAATLARIRTHAKNLRETAASYERTETRNVNLVTGSGTLGTGNVLS